MKVKKIIASAIAAAMATTALAITVSAGTGTVAACPVSYVSEISAAKALSTSGVSANPSANTYSLSIFATYVYRNPSTGVSESDTGYNSSNINGCLLSYYAPIGCEMKSVAADHTFTINNKSGFFDSAASR